MVRTLSFLGFSMAERNHRRVLVIATYFVLGVLMIAIAAVSADVVTVALVWVNLAYNVASAVVLGRLVKDASVFKDVRIGELIGLGLARKPHNPDAMDERDVAVRDAACSKAYRVIGMYVLILVLVIPGLGAMATVRTIEVLLAPLLAIAVTLPQAIILWSEPDVPVEAQA